MDKNKVTNTGITLLIVIGVLLFFIFRNGTAMGVFFNEGEKEDQLKVLGPNEYSFTVDYDDIDTVELITLDESAMTKTGATAKRYHYGLWADPELGDFERCCSIKFQEAVCVTTNDGHKYVFNSESAATTTEMVRMFNDLLAHR